MLNYGFKSIGDLVIAKAARNGDRILIEHEGSRTSYAAFNEQTNRVAHGLLELGLGAGSRVGILLWNDEWPLVAWVALSKIGAWSAFINPHYKGDGLDVLLERLSADTLIVSADILEDVLKTPAGAAASLVIVPGQDGSWQKSKSVVDLASLANHHDGSNISLVEGPDEICGLIHTSGTTGTPKFCLLSHNYYIAFGMIRILEFDTHPTDCIFLPMPLYHSHKHLIGVMLADARMVIAKRFNVSTFWTEVRDCEASILMLHDQPMMMLLNADPGPDDKRHRAQVVHPGWRSRREFHERFGVDAVSTIGSNESQTIALAPRYRSRTDPNFYESEELGLEILHDHFEVRILDGHGLEVPADTIGEIVSRSKSPHIMFEGYFGDSEATGLAFRDGWYHHGDLGRLDETGLLHFVGRKPDGIRHRGEWIPYETVEDVANTHPQISSTALVGVPRELGDEDLKLYVVANDTKLSPLEVVMHLSAHLPYFMVPRYIEFIPELPRTPGLEKIVRGALSRGVSAAWDRKAQED